MAETYITFTGWNPLRSLKAVGNKLYEIERIPARHRRILEERYTRIQAQLVMFGVLAALWVVVTIVNSFTSFFVYPYLQGGVPSLATLASFWPLFLWCGFLIIVSNNHVRSSHLDGELWRSGMILGNLAGVWEELGYRYLFLFPAMLALMFTNWLLTTWFAWIMIILMGIGSVAIFVDDKHSPFSAAKSFFMFLLMICIWNEPDPWFWAYQHVLMPAINWVSWGSFTEIFEHPERHEPLLVMAAILANNWFRDGHKYQGWLGQLDSWVVGFVFLYAAFTYGLLTAVILHCLWNTLVFTSVYCKRKVYGSG